tara:strand:+ start:870 stop:4238 length:3369 start_codon:yes stop_codon:yes gene_type:complete
VCDIEADKCESWNEHCLADGSVEWLKKRQQLNRTLEARRKGERAGYVPRSADEMRRAFAEEATKEGAAEKDMSAEDEAAAQVQEQAAIEDDEAEKLFSDKYEPCHFKNGQPHPDVVVETTSLSFAEPPPITYDLKLPQNIFNPKNADNPTGGALSNLQLETVSYASQRHETILPNGLRAGFFLGDGVGLGKGRQLAGIIAENWMRGRKRHIWISCCAGLIEDAKRDLSDIGFSRVKVANITSFDYGNIDTKGPKCLSRGVLFTTYSALISGQQRTGKTRLAQAIEWLGGDKAEGCILFDESHKAKNLAPEVGTDKAGRPTVKKSSKMAITCQALQNDCPRARVVYCSATGASSLQNMAYMERLGLWGAGTAFTDFGAFNKAIGGGGGVGAMELVALDLKRRGMYICRQLSFSAATFDTKMIDLTPSQEKMYDGAASFWSEMLCAFHYAVNEVLHVKDVKGPPHPKTGRPQTHPSSHILGQYWGAHQRFFRALCMAIKVPELIETAKAALAADKCVVIGLQTTGEARLNDAVKSGEDLEEFAGMKEAVRFLLTKFPTGDYVRQFTESDLDSDDSDDDDLALDVTGATSRANAAKAARAKKKRRAKGDDDESTDEDEDDEEDDLGGFVPDDRDSDDGSDGSDDDEELLPLAVKGMSSGQLRELLRAAKVNDRQCTGRASLLALLEQVEKQARLGNGTTSVFDLIATTKGGKRSTPDSARAPSGRPKQRRYVDPSSDDEVDDDATMVDFAIGSDSDEMSPPHTSDDEEMDEAAKPAKAAAKAAKPAKATAKAAKPAKATAKAEEDGVDLSWAQHTNEAEIKMLQRLKKQLIRKLDALTMPENPLDQLIDELGGADAVSELTGRKGRLLRDEDGVKTYQKRNAGMVDSDGRMVAMERINLAEKKAFMDGRKLVAIISEAASSGISLQADRRVENIRKRVHITLELPWSADQTIQQCGRTHRSNQVHGPEYVLAMTACGGERRFASTVAKRLQQLGAITKGDRRAADASDLSMFDVDTKWGKKAFDELIEVLSNPLFSSTRPPPPYVRRALGLQANDELHTHWKAHRFRLLISLYLPLSPYLPLLCVGVPRGGRGGNHFRRHQHRRERQGFPQQASRRLHQNAKQDF